MRDYPRECFLASVWKTTKQTIHNTRQRMLDWFYELLKPELTVHSLNWRMQHGGTYFMHDLTTFVVDGSEQEA